jgi:hypothetical protein
MCEARTSSGKISNDIYEIPPACEKGERCTVFVDTTLEGFSKYEEGHPAWDVSNKRTEWDVPISRSIAGADIDLGSAVGHEAFWAAVDAKPACDPTTKARSDVCFPKGTATEPSPSEYYVRRGKSLSSDNHPIDYVFCRRHAKIYENLVDENNPNKPKKSTSRVVSQ